MQVHEYTSTQKHDFKSIQKHRCTSTQEALFAKEVYI